MIVTIGIIMFNMKYGKHLIFSFFFLFNTFSIFLFTNKLWNIKIFSLITLLTLLTVQAQRTKLHESVFLLHLLGDGREDVLQ